MWEDLSFRACDEGQVWTSDAPCLRGSVAEVETLIHGGDLPPVLADLCAGAGTQVIAV